MMSENEREKQTPGLEFYTPVDHLSPSCAMVIARCRRRWFYKYGCRLREPGPPHVALLFGEAIHHAIPHALDGDLKKAEEVFREKWGDTEGDRKRNPGRARVMLQSFAEAHKPGQSIYNVIPPPKAGWKGMQKYSKNELPFAVDIGLDLMVVGRIDAVGEHRDTGDVFAIEYKTSSEVSTRYMSAWSMSPQVLTYTLALAMEMRGREVKGCFLEALQVAIQKVETLCIPVYVEESHLRDLVNWYGEQRAKITVCEQHGVWPKNIAMCNPYSCFGLPGYNCEYQKLCLEEDWTDLREMYEVEEKRPFSLEVSDESSQTTIPLDGGEAQQDSRGVSPPSEKENSREPATG